MTAAVTTELTDSSKLRRWDSFTIKNLATVGDSDLVSEYYRILEEQLQVKPETARSTSLAAPQWCALCSRYIVANDPSPEGMVDTLMTTAPEAVQSFFQHTESQLMAGTEITAQYALRLLRRIKALVTEIRPNNIQGRLLGLIDIEDGSTRIEWIRNRSGLGFVLDREHESSWFIVLPNGLSKSGYLYGKDGLKSLRGLLEEFVAAGE